MRSCFNSLSQYNQIATGHLTRLAGTTHGACFLHKTISSLNKQISESHVVQQLNVEFEKFGLPTFIDSVKPQQRTTVVSTDNPNTPPSPVMKM